MGNANSGIQPGAVVHGARGYLTLEGKPIGYCQGISFGIGHQMAPIDVLDDVETVEHVPVAYSVTSLSARFVELVGRNLIGMGVQPEQAAMVLGKTMTMEIKDRPTDTARYVLEGVQFTSANWDFSKGNVTSAAVSFVGRRVRYQDGRV